MKATAEQHVRIVKHLMEYAGVNRDRAEFLAIEAWAAVEPIVSDASAALRAALEEAVTTLGQAAEIIHTMDCPDGPLSECDECENVVDEIKRHRDLLAANSITTQDVGTVGSGEREP